MGGKPKNEKRTRRQITKPTPLVTNWDKYSALFDAGEFQKALPYYAQHLKELSQK